MNYVQFLQLCPETASCNFETEMRCLLIQQRTREKHATGRPLVASLSAVTRRNQYAERVLRDCGSPRGRHGVTRTGIKREQRGPLGKQKHFRDNIVVIYM